MFSGRSKDKSKSLAANTDVKQNTTEPKLQVTSIQVAPSTSTGKVSKETSTPTLPPVRGSFQSYDRSKKPKMMQKPEVVVEKPPVKASLDIPSSSWLNKDGQTLASMFSKPKGS